MRLFGYSKARRLVKFMVIGAMIGLVVKNGKRIAFGFVEVPAQGIDAWDDATRGYARECGNRRSC